MPTDLTSAALRVNDPDGTLQVAADSHALFFDAFDGTLGNFTTGGTAPTITGGYATFASNTTASTVSYMRSNLPFQLRPQAYLRMGAFVRLEAAAVTNSTRWWGYGQNQATPTAVNPVLNGAVFVVDYTAGVLYAAVYSGGTRTQQVALTRPTDGAWHKYEVWYRQAVTYYLLDGVTVATIQMPYMAVTSGMYVIAGSVNNTTAPTTAPTLLMSSASMADTSGTVQTIGDGALPTVQATVKQAQAPAPTAVDNPLQVQPLVPASTYLTATAAANTAVTVTLPAPATGLRHHVTVFKVTRFAAAALTASATPVVSTASNHTLVVTLPADAAAQGSVVKDTVAYYSPLAATSQATATTFTLPAVANVIWRLSVAYYTAP